MPKMRYYVYVLARPNGKPFYVGKGARSRVYAHESEARRGHKCHKCNIIRKIWRKGGEVQRYIVFTTNNEAEALEWETKTIEMYGRHTLANHTAGGEGLSGYKHKPQTRRKQSIARKRLLDDPSNRAKNNEHLAKVRPSPERLSEITRERLKDPLERGRRSERAKTQWEATDLRKTVSERAKARWADPAFKERMREIMREKANAYYARKRLDP